MNDLSIETGRRSARPLRRIAALIGGLAVVATAVVAIRASGSDAAGYRTAVVARHDVDSTLRSVGTIEPVSQADVSFPVAGTVESVAVKEGDTVGIGQTLASLDETELTRSLHTAQAKLADTELTLQRALDGEDVSSTGSGSGSTSQSGGSGGSQQPTGVFYDTADSTASSSAETSATAVPVVFVSGSTGGTSSTASSTDSELSAAQQAVLDAQHQANLDLAAAQAALDQATSICTALGEPDAVEEAAATTGSDSSTSASTSTTSSTTSTTAVTGTDVTPCRDALQAVLDAQAQVATSQAAVEKAATALTDLLSERAENSTVKGDSTGNQSASGSGDVGGTGRSSTDASGGAQSSGAASSASSSPTAAELIAFQKQVDAAAAQVVVAEQALAQATIVSPIAGTVVSVGFAAGDSIEAGSDTATILVKGEGGFEVTTTVAVADLPDVEVGAAVGVSPDGLGERIDGEVVTIGVAATDGTTTTSYPVTIALSGDTEGLLNGATATVEIVTARTENAIAVPLSAVTTNGERHTVQVVTDGVASTEPVEIGAVGSEWIEITSGLKVGQKVVLADLDEPLPGSATDSTSTGGNRGNGGGGGGRSGGGGMPSGGPPSGGGPPGFGN
ncbi:MAG: HlyD family efflux transporter periplasmic adaptor subunit [Acidimicrobiales bacterium]|nr:HlyD family efflux transporter periplasmic adaptor subunit [Acidimicrobiales bacterium]